MSFIIHCICAGLLATFLSGITNASAEITRIVYSRGEVANDTRYRDVIEILHTALEKTRPQWGDYTCMPSTLMMPGKRLLRELALPEHSINVAWHPTSKEMEQRFSAIRIPLRKGILGYRVAFIQQKQQSRIDQINTAEDLKKLRFGQGSGWSDNAIYEAHGISVVQGQYTQLFKMLAADRFDLFPRGVGEILAEYQQHQADNPELVIEKNLLIYYPFPYYFFFNKEDRAIKDRIEAGLRIMKKDGSFDTIFKKYHQQAIEKLNLKSRRIIRLSNPNLPPETPLSDSSLWYVPEK
ncbi:type 2 periplasmic-binding domain-containing protein [Undibacterium griseum]|uniref:Transporter substrate-binding domain-containing protein n=1 Tax=Undibacterium griseum TaxID=2762295 RepID=A0ABR6YM07_9BURK|nr:transporter substrate-binding domain-containing protein [Undibacterium griseum]MBC3884894.1 transporter substrate-binding domain-containing protein [Undibacterium griseum]